MLLLALLLSQVPTSTKVCDPTVNSKCAPVSNATPGSSDYGLNVRVVSQPAGASGLTNTELRATVVPVYVDGGTILATQGTSPWVIGDGSGPLTVDGTVAVTNASLANLDVALGTRTKPSDQQHVIIDTIPSTAVTGPLTDTQLRASAVPVSLAVAPTTPITAAALPLPAGAASDSTLSQLLDGGVLARGLAPSGLGVPLSVDPSGVLYVAARALPPLNPFLPRCNPVRRTGCQP